MPKLIASLKEGGGIQFNSDDPNSHFGPRDPAFWVAVITLLAVGWIVGIHFGFKGAVSH
jgi:hypothetical protein